MSVQNEIDRIITAVQAAHAKVAAKGGKTAQPYLVGNLASAIDTIPVGEEVTAETSAYTSLLAELAAAVNSMPG